MRPPKIPKWFLSGFIATLIFFPIAFAYFDIEFTDKLWVAVLGFALLSGILTSFWGRGWFHQGHTPVVVGFIFVVVGLVLTYGTFTYTTIDNSTGELVVKEQMWDLTPQESGVFVLLIVAGVLSIVSGMKQIFANSYWWGRR